MRGERLDTRNPTSKLMLTILAGVATWEREIMLERQREGIAKAKAAGKYEGRPVSIDAAQIRQLRAELGPAAIAKKLGIARSSVYRCGAHSSGQLRVSTHPLDAMDFAEDSAPPSTTLPIRIDYNRDTHALRIRPYQPTPGAPYTR